MNYRKKQITVKDKITGFEGIVTGHADYITGCDQFLVQPILKDNTQWIEARWFDENRLVIVSEKKSVISSKGPKVNDNGCDMPAPIK